MEFRQEYLGGGITAFVSQAHTFGTDAGIADKQADKRIGRESTSRGK